MRQPIHMTWLLTTVFATAFLAAAGPGASQFTSFWHDSRNILEGHWQSCREADGRYAERVYDHVPCVLPPSISD